MRHSSPFDRGDVSRYLLTILGMLAATCISLVIRRWFGNHSAVTIAYLVAILASAWWGGYGPGLLACSLGLFAVPYIFTPNFNPRQTDVARDLLVFFVSLLISRVAARQTRLESTLRLANNTLERSVQERTQELRQSNLELEKVNEALTEFAYSVSHDLQQPLRMMSTYSQLLKRDYQGSLGAEADQYIYYIVQGARQMDALLKDLLAYSLAVNLTVESAGPVNAGGVLREALDHLRDEIQESNATVLFERLPLVKMQACHLLQIFQNLIGNALKYRTLAPPTIEITATREGASWKISVADNGVGIPPEHQERIFGLFKRLHSSDQIQGTGVGLAICQRIVERYGGRIWVTARKTDGSTFHFTIPDASDGEFQDGTHPGIEVMKRERFDLTE